MGLLCRVGGDDCGYIIYAAVLQKEEMVLTWVSQTIP
jgi:hypothetical protein